MREGGGARRVEDASGLAASGGGTGAGGAAGGLARVRRAFAGRRHHPEPDRSAAPVGLSAVLLAVYDVPGQGPSLLYTQRAETMRRHPGEVSFPGGRVDPEDADPLWAALREAHEEVGIAPADVEVLGHLTDYLTYQQVLVCAYVGAPRGPPPAEPVSREEVARVFTVPIARLLAPDHYEARRLPRMGHDRVVHYWHVEPRTVWGVTGELTARFLHHVYGWEPPHDARIIQDVSEFRPR